MSFSRQTRKVHLLKTRTLFLVVALVLHLVWSIVAALDVSSKDTRRTPSHSAVATYNLCIQLLSLCAIAFVLRFDSRQAGSKSSWFSHTLFETVLYALLAVFQFAGALAYSALSPKFECNLNIGTACATASRVILVGCWSTALLYLIFSIWFIAVAVRASKRDRTVWTSRPKSFDWEGRGNEEGTTGHDALITPSTASPLGILGVGEKRKGGTSTVVTSPAETTTAVTTDLPRKTTMTWMFPTLPTLRQGPRPRLESTPHLPIQNLPPPTPFTAAPPGSAATATFPSSTIPPVPSLPLHYNQPLQEQQEPQQQEQRPESPLSPLQYQPQQHQQPMTVRLSPIPQDVPEDISLSGTPAALRPVSLAQSLAQKQRQMIMSIKPLRLGRTGGGRTSIDKSTIGKPKEIDQTRRHLSFEEGADADADTASSLAESKYMSMTMTAAEATFSHWWRPESSQTQAAAAAAVAPMPPVSRVQTQTTYPISSVHASPQVLRPTRSMSPPRAKVHVRSLSHDQFGVLLEPPTSIHHHHHHFRNSNNNSKHNSNVSSKKYLEVASVSSRYSTGTTIPPTPPPKDRWRTLPQSLEVQPHLDQVVQTATTATTVIPPLPTTTTTAVGVVRPPMTRSNTYNTTTTTATTATASNVTNAISERRFMTSPTRGFI